MQPTCKQLVRSKMRIKALTCMQLFFFGAIFFSGRLHKKLNIYQLQVFFYNITFWKRLGKKPSQAHTSQQVSADNANHNFFFSISNSSIRAQCSTCCKAAYNVRLVRLSHPQPTSPTFSPEIRHLHANIAQGLPWSNSFSLRTRGL